MEDFEKRRDRFEFFESFENPQLNITCRLEVPNFIPFCKSKGYPPFHFFLFHLLQAVKKTPNFLYRIHEGEVILIDRILPSYTVMNENQDLNFTRFQDSEDLEEFIRRSLASRDEAVRTSSFINTGHEFDKRTMKDNLFITCLPWFDFTSIQHPVFRSKSADIPSIAWGKFKVEGKIISFPISIQAHHGFVDGYHVHQLLENLKESLSKYG